MTFVTRDGRSATRALPAPSALRPVVEGLLVTLPSSAPRATAVTSSVANAPSAPNSSICGECQNPWPIGTATLSISVKTRKPTAKIPAAKVPVAKAPGLRGLISRVRKKIKLP